MNEKTTTLFEMDDYKRKVMKKAEVKRVAENITKRELSDMLNINNSYYGSCLGNNVPSDMLIDVLEGYINMETSEVYKKIFEGRHTPSIVRGNKFFIDKNGKAKETFLPKSKIEGEYYEIYDTIKDKLNWSEHYDDKDE